MGRAVASQQRSNNLEEEALLQMQMEEAIQLSLALEASRAEFEKEEKVRALYRVNPSPFLNLHHPNLEKVNNEKRCRTMLFLFGAFKAYGMVC